MNVTRRDFAKGSALVVGLATLKTKKAQAQNVTAAEARALAKEAYIYGEPIVDNYRIQHAYWVDKANPEFKGGVESHLEQPASLHSGRRGDPNAQYRHAVFDGRSRPTG